MLSWPSHTTDMCNEIFDLSMLSYFTITHAVAFDSYGKSTRILKKKLMNCLVREGVSEIVACERCLTA